MESNAAYPIAASEGRDGTVGSQAASRALNVTPFRAPANLVRILTGMAVVGAITLAAGSLLAPERTWANLLLASYYVLMLGLAGVLLIAIEYVTGAGWSVALRRVPEAMAGTLPAGAALFVLVLVVSPWLYPWFHEGHAGGEGTTWFRGLWLTPWFFYIRSAIYLAVWIAFARKMVARSRQQDADGDLSHTHANGRWSAAFLVVFGVTLWLASFDWIMSLEPHWYSTIFGVYHFAGLILGGLAMTTIVAIWLERLGPLRGILTAGAPARPRQTAVRLQHVLDVHLVQPVHADLVRQHP